jgi:hypothetical protein
MYPRLFVMMRLRLGFEVSTGVWVLEIGKVRKRDKIEFGEFFKLKTQNF